jgi:glycosyltransferase involved in cell wall biosynthesis
MKQQQHTGTADYRVPPANKVSPSYKMFLNLHVLMKSYPKITVITPNYNQGKFLEQAILSVLDQQYPNIEYIVIDGKSTDESVEVIKKYAYRISYWVSEKDKGQTDAINKGLQKATGDIITWLNGDDYFLPGTFEFVAGEYKKNPFDFILGNCRFVDVNGHILPDQKKSSLRDEHRFIPGDPACIVNQPSSFFSRNIIEKTGLLDDSLHYAMDVDFWMKIMAHNGKIIYVDREMTCFRRHDEAKSAGGNLPFIRETLNSPFFNDELKSIHPAYYRLCKKSIYKSYIQNLKLEHASKELSAFFIKAFKGYPLMALKEYAGYGLTKLRLGAGNRIRKKNARKAR